MPPLPKKLCHDIIRGHICGLEEGNSDNNDIDGGDDARARPISDAAKVCVNLLEEARKELWPGCSEASKLGFIDRLYQIKWMHNLSNKAMEDVLALFRSMLPEGHCAPNTFDEIKKLVRDLGLDYEKIDACVNALSKLQRK